MTTDILVCKDTVQAALATLSVGSDDSAMRFFQHLGIPDAGEFLHALGETVEPEEVQTLQFRMSAALGDASERRARCNARLLAELPIHGDDKDATIDAVSHGLLRSIGLAPAEIYLLTGFCEEASFVNRYGRSVLGQPKLVALSRELEPPELEIIHNLGAGSLWLGGTVAFNDGRSHPETVRARAEGRPLHEVLRHPLLDDHDLRIVDWRDDGDIVTDAPRVRIFP